MLISCPSCLFVPSISLSLLSFSICLIQVFSSSVPVLSPLDQCYRTLPRNRQMEELPLSYGKILLHEIKWSIFSHFYCEIAFCSSQYKLIKCPKSLIKLLILAPFQSSISYQDQKSFAIMGRGLRARLFHPYLFKYYFLDAVPRSLSFTKLTDWRGHNTYNCWALNNFYFFKY